MEVSNVLLDNGVVSIYFKHTDYCVRTELTFNTYRMYCEFNKIPLNDYQYNSERLIAIDLNSLISNKNIGELIAL